MVQTHLLSFYCRKVESHSMARKCEENSINIKSKNTWKRLKVRLLCSVPFSFDSIIENLLNFFLIESNRTLNASGNGFLAVIKNEPDVVVPPVNALNPPQVGTASDWQISTHKQINKRFAFLFVESTFENGFIYKSGLNLCFHSNLLLNRFICWSRKYFEC